MEKASSSYNVAQENVQYRGAPDNPVKDVAANIAIYTALSQYLGDKEFSPKNITDSYREMASAEK